MNRQLADEQLHREAQDEVARYHAEWREPNPAREIRRHQF
jgi:hypothetical protein